MSILERTVPEVVAVTGLSRSSLYATYGGKQDLYVQALRRYVERRSEPMFETLASDGRGLPAVAAGDQLRPGLDLDGVAESLALLAYGVNVRSRAGADPESLHRGVAATLDALRPTRIQRRRR